MQLFNRNFKIIVLFVCLSLTIVPVCAASESPYLMTDNQGTVGILDTQTGAWVHETQIPVRSLSKYDQTLLEEGIPLYTQADIASAMEDFCS